MIRRFVLALLAASAFAGAALSGVAHVHATTGASQGSVEAVTWLPPKITR